MELKRARPPTPLRGLGFPAFLAQFALPVVGELLLMAAALKFWQEVHSPIRINPPSGIPEFIPGLIGWQVFLALWLISGALPNMARRTAMACFALFGAYAFYEAVVGKSDCGCFGQLHVNPWFTVALDSAVVLTLWFLAKPARGEPIATGVPRRHLWLFSGTLAIGILVAVGAAAFQPALITRANGLLTADDGIVLLEPQKWLGHKLPVLANIRAQPGGAALGRRLAHGRWVVLFYHAGCNECRATIPIYETLAQQESNSGQIPHVAFVRVPSGSGSSQAGLFHSNLALHGTLDSNENWFAQTPIVVQLRNGVVIRMATGSAAMNLGWLKR